MQRVMAILFVLVSGCGNNFGGGGPSKPLTAREVCKQNGDILGDYVGLRDGMESQKNRGVTREQMEWLFVAPACEYGNYDISAGLDAVALGTAGDQCRRCLNAIVKEVYGPPDDPPE